MQNFDLVGVNAAVGVHMDRHLVEVIGAAPLEGYQFPDVREVNMENIAVECHFPHIGSHVGDLSLGHAVSDQRLLLWRHHHMKMDTAPPLFCQRSSRSRLRRLGGCSRTLSSGFSDRGGTGRLLMMPSIMFPFCSIESSAFLLELCSCSINILLSLAPVRGIFLLDGLPTVSLGLFCGGFHLFPDRTGPVGIVGRRPQLIVRRLPLC